MKKPLVVKQLATLMIWSVLAVSLVGCTDGEAEKKEKADAEFKQWVEQGSEFKHSEPEKSAF